MKKKILALAMAAIMLIVAVVGGTLAYFTDTDEATNVFTFGNVQIIQREGQRKLGEDEWVAYDDDAPVVDAEKATIEAFEDNKNIFPAVLNKLTKVPVTVNGYDFNIRSLDGNYVDKIVSVYNDGTEDAYIRTIIAVPSINGYDDDPDASDNPLHWNYLDSTDFEGIGWDWNGSDDEEATTQLCYVEKAKIEGVEYDIYVATYNAAVAPEAWTSPSMVGFYLHDTVDYDEEEGYFFIDKNGHKYNISTWMKPGVDGKVTMNILVATQACQTAGFENAWEALDEAFGKIESGNLPWAEDEDAA